MTKLTLSVDETVVEVAKRIAEANNTSVSAMFSQFVQSLAASRARGGKTGPLTRKLSGIMELPPKPDYKELVTDALSDKYGAAE